MKLGLIIFLPFILIGCGVENEEVEAPDQSIDEAPAEEEPVPEGEDSANEVDTPEFVAIEQEDTIVDPATEELSFTVTNHHEEYEVFGGEYYQLEIYIEESWEDITPVDDFIDIGYSINEGESHEFTHRLLADDQEQLDPGHYRIRKEFMLIEGSEDIPANEAESFEIAVEFEVEE